VTTYQLLNKWRSLVVIFSLLLDLYKGVLAQEALMPFTGKILYYDLEHIVRDFVIMWLFWLGAYVSQSIRGRI
jgi:hypothetical protein